ncbi:MAG: hypothetical protein LBG93_06775 [Treponema sp.]|jgi:hypothetical protein|nr:hypothetical protein [Treponema sp.]
MTQSQVKEKLLAVQDAPQEFTVIFSGKKSKKVNGLYKPDSCEIIIHNRNFSDDNLLLYTAIHEYAHHLHACARGGHLSPRAHTAEFWAILHDLLEKAEKKEIYKDVFSDSKELETLTDTIRKKYLSENGNLVKELGQLLLKAHEICAGIGGRYEDYIDRVLRIPRQAANLAVRMFQYNLNPETGADNMRFLAGIANEEKRIWSENALLTGKSPDTVKMAIRQKPDDDEDSSRARLEKEKTRLERTIATLSKRLEEVKRELDE